jgi:hypothetical protein
MKSVSQIWTRLLWSYHCVVHKLGEELSWDVCLILLLLQASLHPGNELHLLSHVSPPPQAMVPKCVTVRHCGICSDEKEELWRHTVERLERFVAQQYMSTCCYSCWFASSATARWSSCSKIFDVHMQMSMCAIVFWIMTPWEVDINVSDDYSSSEALVPSYRNKTLP